MTKRASILGGLYVCAILLLGVSLQAVERTRVTVLSTTDLHGHVLPVNYFNGGVDQVGLAKIATLVARERADSPKALLLDIGDTIQGSPLSYYHARKNPGPVDPMMLVMNHLGYDSMTVGNHEYNFGPQVLGKAHGEAKFPWLSANILRKDTKAPFFQPYLLREVNGVRVAIVGITTVGIPNWEDARNIEGLEFANPVEVARSQVAALRGSGKVDLVILAMHMGLEEDLMNGFRQPGQIPYENSAIEIARTVPGVDLILLGHTHRRIPNLVINGALLAQAGRWGDTLIRADLYLEREGQGAWSVIAKSSKAIPVSEEVPADPAVVALVDPYEKEAQAWLVKSIGTCAQEINSRESRKQDSALIDLIQRVQMEASGADISFASSFSLDARVAAGPVSVRDIYSLYFYENTLLMVEMTGAQVRAALEHSARFYLPYATGKSLDELEDKRVPGYNFDAAEGVEYVMDLRRPLGDRIVGLSYQGKPIDPERKFRVAVNNYRRNGGGGYKMFHDCPVLYQSSAEVRDLIIEWVEKHRDIPITATNNWRIELGP